MTNQRPGEITVLLHRGAKVMPTPRLNWVRLSTSNSAQWLIA